MFPDIFQLEYWIELPVVYWKMESSLVIKLSTINIILGRISCRGPFHNYPISDKILWEFEKKCLTPLPPLSLSVSLYTMLQTHNIAWRNFCSLFLNIFKRGKGYKFEIVQIAVSPIIFVTDCLKISEKLNVVFYSCSFYIKLKSCNYPLRHNFAMIRN